MDGTYFRLSSLTRNWFDSTDTFPLHKITVRFADGLKCSRMCMFKIRCGRVFFLCEKLPKGDTDADFWWRISFEEKQVAKFLPFNFFWQFDLSRSSCRQRRHCRQESVDSITDPVPIFSLMFSG